MSKKISDNSVERVIELLDLHYDAFRDIVDAARETGHPVPIDTRAWAQILVSVLTGIKGLQRKKGADLEDGSDVKGAFTWEAIDAPRFNGVVKAGTRAATSGKIESLDSMPYLFLVLWDNAPETDSSRCRIWCVRTQVDHHFREVCKAWYRKHEAGEIRSTNFQLHPPRGTNSNIIRNTCGNLVYPLLFCAERPQNGKYTLNGCYPGVMETGLCRVPSIAAPTESAESNRLFRDW